LFIEAWLGMAVFVTRIWIMLDSGCQFISEGSPGRTDGFISADAAIFSDAC
jgi:hypothetical protein